MPPRYHPTTDTFRNRIPIFEAATMTVADVGLSEDSRKALEPQAWTLHCKQCPRKFCQEISIGHPQDLLSKGHGRRLSESEWKWNPLPALCCWRWTNVLEPTCHGFPQGQLPMWQMPTGSSLSGEMVLGNIRGLPALSMLATRHFPKSSVLTVSTQKEPSE